MSQEILYTSAAAGLKRGSHGFCTVVSTDGMARNLAEKLEALSGYRHAFPLHDPRSARNPVNYSHLTIQVGGRRYNVLSRIADAGLDYTQRNNKLAHHVALDESERVPAGPAALLATPRFCKTQWDGTPRIIPRRRAPENCPENTGPCQAWNGATGDAGWAGVIAEHLLAEREKPISIIFPLGMETLRLTTEVLCLLPVERRWDVTFSTYFTKLPAGLQCRLRFVLDGTQEAKALRRHPHVALVDLVAKLGPARGDTLVEAARTVRRSAPPPAEHDAPSSSPNFPKPGRSEPPDSWDDIPESPTAARPAGYALSMPGSRPPGRRPPRKPGRLPVHARRKNPWLRRSALILVPLLLFALLGTGGYFALYRRRSPSESGKSVAANDPAASGKGGAFAPHPPGHSPTHSTNDGQKGPDGLLDIAETPSGTESNPKGIPNTEPSSEPKQSAKNRPEPGVVKNNAPPPEDPFIDLPERLDLPVIPTQLGREPRPRLLGPVHLPAGKKLVLKIVVQSPEEWKLLGLGQASFKIKRVGDSDWNVIVKGPRPPDDPVGLFTLKGDKLIFHWADNVRPANSVFRYARLHLSVGNNQWPTTRKLTAPIFVKHVPLVEKGENAKSIAFVKMPAKKIETLPDTLRLHLILDVWTTGLSGEKPKHVKIAIGTMGVQKGVLYTKEMDEPPFKKKGLRPIVKLAVHLTEKNGSPILRLRRLARAVVVKVRRTKRLENVKNLDTLLSVETFPRAKSQKSGNTDDNLIEWKARPFDNNLGPKKMEMAHQDIQNLTNTIDDRLKQGRKNLTRGQSKSHKLNGLPKLSARLHSLEMFQKNRLPRARRIVDSYRFQYDFLRQHAEDELDKATIHYVLYVMIGKRRVVLVTTE